MITYYRARIKWTCITKFSPHATECEKDLPSIRSVLDMMVSEVQEENSARHGFCRACAGTQQEASSSNQQGKKKKKKTRVKRAGYYLITMFVAVARYNVRISRHLGEGAVNYSLLASG